MRKRSWIRAIAYAVTVTMLCAFPVEASNMGQRVTMEKVNRRNSFLTGRERYSLGVAYGETRGSIISQATVGITDKGAGEIEILIETLAQKKSDEIRHIAILELLEPDDSWTEISRYEFDALKENYPDEDLSGLTNEFRVKKLEVDRYYRIRGIHFVWIDGKSQGFSTSTDALLIKEYPG